MMEAPSNLQPELRHCVHKPSDDANDSLSPESMANAERVFGTTSISIDEPSSQASRYDDSGSSSTITTHKSKSKLDPSYNIDSHSNANLPDRNDSEWRRSNKTDDDKLNADIQAKHFSDAALNILEPSGSSQCESSFTTTEKTKSHPVVMTSTESQQKCNHDSCLPDLIPSASSTYNVRSTHEVDPTVCDDNYTADSDRISPFIEYTADSDRISPSMEYTNKTPPLPCTSPPTLQIVHCRSPNFTYLDVEREIVIPYLDADNMPEEICDTPDKVGGIYPAYSNAVNDSLDTSFNVETASEQTDTDSDEIEFVERGNNSVYIDDGQPYTIDDNGDTVSAGIGEYNNMTAIAGGETEVLPDLYGILESSNTSVMGDKNSDKHNNDPLEVATSLSGDKPVSQSISLSDTHISEYGNSETQSKTTVGISRIDEMDFWSEPTEEAEAEFEAILQALNRNYASDPYQERFAGRRDRYGFILSPILESQSPTPSSLSGYSGMSSASPDPLCMFRMSPGPNRQKQDLDLSSLGLPSLEQDTSEDRTVPIYQHVHARRCFAVPEGQGWESGDDLLSPTGVEEWDQYYNGLSSPPICASSVNLTQFGTHITGWKQPDVAIFEEQEESMSESDTSSDDTIGRSSPSSVIESDVTIEDEVERDKKISSSPHTNELFSTDIKYNECIEHLKLQNQELELSLLEAEMDELDDTLRKLKEVAIATEYDDSSEKSVSDGNKTATIEIETIVETKPITPEGILIVNKLDTSTQSNETQPNVNDIETEYCNEHEIDEHNNDSRLKLDKTTTNSSCTSEDYQRDEQQMQPTSDDDSNASDDNDDAEDEYSDSDDRSESHESDTEYFKSKSETVQTSTEHESETIQEDDVCVKEVLSPRSALILSGGMFPTDSESSYTSDDGDVEESGQDTNMSSFGSGIVVRQYTSEDSDDNRKRGDTKVCTPPVVEQTKVNPVVSFRRQYEVRGDQAKHIESKQPKKEETVPVNINSPLDFSIFGSSFDKVNRHEDVRSPRVFGRYYDEMDENMIKEVNENQNVKSEPVVHSQHNTVIPEETAVSEVESNDDLEMSFKTISFLMPENEMVTSTTDCRYPPNASNAHAKDEANDHAEDEANDHAEDEEDRRNTHIHQDREYHPRYQSSTQEIKQPDDHHLNTPTIFTCVSTCSDDDRTKLSENEELQRQIDQYKAKKEKSKKASQVKIKVSHLGNQDSFRTNIKHGYVHALSEIFMQKGRDNEPNEPNKMVKKSKRKNSKGKKTEPPTVLTPNENLIIKGATKCVELGEGHYENEEVVSNLDAIESLGFETTPLERVEAFEKNDLIKTDDASTDESASSGSEATPSDIEDVENHIIEQYEKQLQYLEDERDQKDDSGIDDNNIIVYSSETELLPGTTEFVPHTDTGMLLEDEQRSGNTFQINTWWEDNTGNNSKKLASPNHNEAQNDDDNDETFTQPCHTLSASPVSIQDDSCNITEIESDDEAVVHSCDDTSEESSKESPAVMLETYDRETKQISPTLLVREDADSPYEDTDEAHERYEYDTGRYSEGGNDNTGIESDTDASEDITEDQPIVRYPNKPHPSLQNESYVANITGDPHLTSNNMPSVPISTHQKDRQYLDKSEIYERSEASILEEEKRFDSSLYWSTPNISIKQNEAKPCHVSMPCFGDGERIGRRNSDPAAVRISSIGIQYPPSLSRRLYGPYIRQRNMGKDIEAPPHEHTDANLSSSDVINLGATTAYGLSTDSSRVEYPIKTVRHDPPAELMGYQGEYTDSVMRNGDSNDLYNYERREMNSVPLHENENTTKKTTFDDDVNDNEERCELITRIRNPTPLIEDVSVNPETFEHTCYEVNVPSSTQSWGNLTTFNSSPITYCVSDGAQRDKDSKNILVNANRCSALPPMAVNGDASNDIQPVNSPRSACQYTGGETDLISNNTELNYLNTVPAVVCSSGVNNLGEQLKNSSETATVKNDLCESNLGVNIPKSTVSNEAAHQNTSMRHGTRLVDVTVHNEQVTSPRINHSSGNKTQNMNQPHMSTGNTYTTDSKAHHGKDNKWPRAGTADAERPVYLQTADYQHVLEDEKGNLKLWPYSDFENSDKLPVTVHKARKKISKVVTTEGMTEQSTSMTIIQSAQHSAEMPENRLTEKYQTSAIVPANMTHGQLMKTHGDSIQAALLNDANGNGITEADLAAVLPQIAESVNNMKHVDAEEILPGITQSVTKLKNGGNLVITTMTRKLDEIESDSSGRGSPEPAHPVLNVDDLENSQIYLVQDSNGELFYVEDVTSETQESAYYSSRNTSESLSDGGNSPSCQRISKIKQVGDSGIKESKAEEILSAMYQQGGECIQEIDENEEEWSERTYEYEIPRRRKETEPQRNYSKESFQSSYMVEEPETLPRGRTSTKDRHETSFEMSGVGTPCVYDGGMAQTYSQATQDVRSTADDYNSSMMLSTVGHVGDGALAGTTRSTERYTLEAEAEVYPLVPMPDTTIYSMPPPPVILPPVCAPVELPQYSLVQVDLTPKKDESVTAKLDVSEHNKITEVDDRPIYKTVAHIQTREKQPPVKSEMTDTKRYKILASKASSATEEVQESHMNIDEVDYKFTRENVEYRTSPIMQNKHFFVRNSTNIEPSTRFRSEKRVELNNNNSDQKHRTEIRVQDNSRHDEQKTIEESSSYSYNEMRAKMEQTNSDMKVVRGSYLIKNTLDEVDESLDDNLNMFDGSFTLRKDNPLYQSDEDIYKRFEREKAEKLRKQDRFQRNVNQDISFETVDRFSKSKTVKRDERPKMSLNELLLSRISTIDAKDIRQYIDVKHHSEDLYGDPRFLHADGSSGAEWNTSGGNNNFDAVGEKVDLLMKEGKAYITVTVTADRITPVDMEFNVWRKNQAIVTRTIEIDLLANEQRRLLYYKVMEQPGHGKAGLRAGPNETILDSEQTLDLFTKILGANDWEGDKEDITVRTKSGRTTMPFSSGMDLLY